MLVHLLAHDRMVGAQELQPAHVPDPFVQLRRGFDVGEEHGHGAVGRGTRPQARALRVHAGRHFLDGGLSIGRLPDPAPDQRRCMGCEGDSPPEERPDGPEIPAATGRPDADQEHVHQHVKRQVGLEASREHV
jgi:hypothetical protein